MAKGANVNAWSNTGITPVDQATQMGHDDFATDHGGVPLFGVRLAARAIQIRDPTIPPTITSTNTVIPTPIST